MPLYVKLLNPNAKAPTCSHPGEDLGFDVYALEDTTVTPNVTPVRTGVAAKYVNGEDKYGMLVKDRSSMASKGVTSCGGVIDHGYTGEIIILLKSRYNYFIKKGDKVAQLVATRVHTDSVFVVEDLGESSRGDKGFGSTGIK